MEKFRKYLREIDNHRSDKDVSFVEFFKQNDIMLVVYRKNEKEYSPMPLHKLFNDAKINTDLSNNLHKIYIKLLADGLIENKTGNIEKDIETCAELHFNVRKFPYDAIVKQKTVMINTET